VVLLRLESRKVLEHRWRLADQPLQRIQVDHVLPAVLKVLESLEVRANQQVLAAHRAPANLSTNKRQIGTEISLLLLCSYYAQSRDEYGQVDVWR